MPDIFSFSYKSSPIYYKGELIWQSMQISHMIQRLIRYISRKRTPIVKEEIDSIPVSVYDRLKFAIDRLETKGVHLSVRPHSLGYIDCYSENMEDFIKSLKEAIDTLKENKHIEPGLFYINQIKSVRFDDLLFVQGDHYAENPNARIQRAIILINQYYDLMKDADKALYGYMEYNHRQLYNYTLTLINFLELLFTHFGN